MLLRLKGAQTSGVCTASRTLRLSLAHHTSSWGHSANDRKGWLSTETSKTSELIRAGMSLVPVARFLTGMGNGNGDGDGDGAV